MGGCRWVGWIPVGVGAAVAGEATEALLPASHLLLSLVAGLGVACTGIGAGQVPRQVNLMTQALLGVVTGAYLSLVALASVGGSVGPLVAVTVGTVVISLACARVLTRIGGLDPVTATLGASPGASAVAIASAQDLGGDAVMVAFLQYLRVASVALAAPVVANWLMTRPPGHRPGAHEDFWRLVDGSDQALGAALLAVITVVGVQAGRWLRLASPTLAGPMFLTVLLTNGGLTGFIPSDTVQEGLFTIVGLDIGLRFTRRTLAHIRRMLPLAVATTVAVNLCCALMACSLAPWIGVPPLDAYLATSPGGINAVLACAVASHVNVPLVSSVHGLRMFAMAGLTPQLVRRLTRRHD